MVEAIAHSVRHFGGDLQAPSSSSVEELETILVVRKPAGRCQGEKPGSKDFRS